MYFFLGDNVLSGQIKIICKHCGDRAVITKNDRQTVEYSRLYCICKNPACGHSWVADIQFSHTLKESRLTKEGVLNYLLDNLPFDSLKSLKLAIEKAENKQLGL